MGNQRTGDDLGIDPLWNTADVTSSASSSAATARLGRFCPCSRSQMCPWEQYTRSPSPRSDQPCCVGKSFRSAPKP